VILAAATVLVILACGAIATAAALPAGHSSIPARLAAVFGLGYATVLWPATALTLVHLLQPWSLALLLAAVTCLLLVWTLRRTPARDLLAGLRHEARAHWPVVAFGLLAVTANAIARLAAFKRNEVISNPEPYDRAMPTTSVYRRIATEDPAQVRR
jgi:hypothetical protein